MSIETLSTLMLVQFALEAVLVVLIITMLKRARRIEKADPAQMPENLKNSIEKFLIDSENIAQVFAKTLKDKKNLSADLILKLDRRLSDYQEILKQTEASFSVAKKNLDELKKNQQHQQATQPPSPSSTNNKANPAAPEVRAQVLKMAKEGYPPEAIASKVHLHLGEVELIIDLERQFSV